MADVPMIRINDATTRLSTCEGALKITDELKPYRCLNLAVDLEGLLDFRALNGEEALERKLGAELIKVITDTSRKGPASAAAPEDAEDALA